MGCGFLPQLLGDISADCLEEIVQRTFNAYLPNVGGSPWEGLLEAPWRNRLPTNAEQCGDDGGHKSADSFSTVLGFCNFAFETVPKSAELMVANDVLCVQ